MVIHSGVISQNPWGSTLSLFLSPPLLFSFFPFSLPFFPLFCPPFPLEVGPLRFSYGVSGSAVSSPSGVWGGAPAEIEFGAFSALKCDISWQQFE